MSIPNAVCSGSLWRICDYMVEKEGLPVYTESYWVTRAIPFFLPFLHWLSLRVNVGHHHSCRVGVMRSVTNILSPFLVHQLTHPCRVPLSELMSREEAICESFLPGVLSTLAMLLRGSDSGWVPLYSPGWFVRWLILLTGEIGWLSDPAVTQECGWRMESPILWD